MLGCLTDIDISNLNKYDSQRLYKIYDIWPQIARESYENNYDMVDFKDINHLVFAGMGGSVAIGDIFSPYYLRRKFMLTLLRVTFCRKLLILILWLSRPVYLETQLKH